MADKKLQYLIKMVCKLAEPPRVTNDNFRLREVAPRTDFARGLAIVEGVGGQLFLAVMVMRFVSLYARGASGRRV